MSFLPRVRSSSGASGREPMHFVREPWRASAVREGLGVSLSKPQRKVQQQLMQQQNGGAQSLRSSTSMVTLRSSATSDGMPNLELGALNAIKRREDSLSRLHGLLLHGCVPATDNVDLPAFAAMLASTRAQVIDALHALRLAGIEVVEAIVRWRRRRRQQLEPFVWNSHNYLLKMLVDVFFLGLAETVADASTDPFLLEIGNTSPNADAMQRSSNGTQEGTVAPEWSARRARQRKLARTFSPDRRHTKHELVRMWAAQRVLEAERAQVGSAFDPISPVLQPEDYEVRRSSALIFLGDGEPNGLQQYMPKGQERGGSSRGSLHRNTRPPDPAYKPEPRRAGLQPQQTRRPPPPSPQKGQGLPRQDQALTSSPTSPSQSPAVDPGVDV